jgi:hypothetical protein
MRNLPIVFILGGTPLPRMAHFQTLRQPTKLKMTQYQYFSKDFHRNVLVNVLDDSTLVNLKVNFTVELLPLPLPCGVGL